MEKGKPGGKKGATTECIKGFNVNLTIFDPQLQAKFVSEFRGNAIMIARLVKSFEAKHQL